MGAAFIFSLGLLAFLSVPLITGAFARRMGRPFLKWFLIGTVLPGIAVVIIFFLPDLSEKQN